MFQFIIMIAMGVLGIALTFRAINLKAKIKKCKEEKGEPQFTHDSSCCYFLGRYRNEDLYACPNDMGTVLARWSNIGQDYSSGVGFIPMRDDLLAAWVLVLLEHKEGTLPRRIPFRRMEKVVKSCYQDKGIEYPF